jgi:hypothetical protein
LDSSGSGFSQVAGFCECGNEHFGFGKKFFYWLSDYQLLKKGAASLS